MATTSVQECEEYLDTHGIQGVLKEAIAKLCQDRPANPYKYLRDYFDRFEKVSLIFKFHKITVIINMQEHTSNTSEKMIPPTINTPENVEPPPSNIVRGRRMAVSASVMTEEQATSYVKKVSPPVTKSFVNIYTRKWVVSGDEVNL